MGDMRTHCIHAQRQPHRRVQRMLKLSLVRKTRSDRSKMALTKITEQTLNGDKDYIQDCFPRVPPELVLRKRSVLCSSTSDDADSTASRLDVEETVQQSPLVFGCFDETREKPLII